MLILVIVFIGKFIWWFVDGELVMVYVFLFCMNIGFVVIMDVVDRLISMIVFGVLLCVSQFFGLFIFLVINFLMFFNFLNNVIIFVVLFIGNVVVINNIIN